MGNTYEKMPKDTTKVKLVDFIKHKDTYTFNDNMIPYAVNYFFDNENLRIVDVREYPMRSENPLYKHVALRGVTDDCYIWFTEKQFESIVPK